MAAWVVTLREPVRGLSEGLVAPAHAHPFRATLHELLAVLPPFTVWTLARQKAGSGVLVRNLAGALVIAVGAWALILLTGDPEQWIALGIGTYAAFSWVQALGLRDAPAYAMMFRSRAFIYAAVGFPTISLVAYAFGGWAPPYFMRVHGISATEAGVVLGISFALGGWLGVTLGGVVADRLKPRIGNARVYVGLFSVVGTLPTGLGLLLTNDLITAYVFNFLVSVFGSCWIGAAASTVNDLVMPRMRAIASAFYLLMATVGLALGPYTVGEVSDVLTVAGLAPGEALRWSLLLSLSFLAIPGTLLVLLRRHLIPAEETRLERALAAGEPR